MRLTIRWREDRKTKKALCKCPSRRRQRSRKGIMQRNHRRKKTMVLENYFSGAKKDPQSQKFARTAPKNFLNNSRGLLVTIQQNKGFEANRTRKFTRTFGKIFVTKFLCGTFPVPKFHPLHPWNLLSNYGRLGALDSSLGIGRNMLLAMSTCLDDRFSKCLLNSSLGASPACKDMWVCTLVHRNRAISAICDCNCHRGPGNPAISETRLCNPTLHFSGCDGQALAITISSCDCRAETPLFLQDF